VEQVILSFAEYPEQGLVPEKCSFAEVVVTVSILELHAPLEEELWPQVQRKDTLPQ